MIWGCDESRQALPAGSMGTRQEQRHRQLRPPGGPAASRRAVLPYGGAARRSVRRGGLGGGRGILVAREGLAQRRSSLPVVC